jgi:FkbM family methyltransferase
MMLRDAETGIFFRKGDRLILQEGPGVYGNVPVEPGDVVLDLGAHIGTASLIFLDKGAAGTIAVEADPANLPYLRRNLAGRKAVIIPAAVGAKPGRADFWTRPDRGYVGSLMPDKGRKRVTVGVVALSGLLKQYRPTIVKCDIEFGEYGLPELRSLPEQVRVVAMEVHIRYAGIFERRITPEELRANRERASDLMAGFEAQGFREHWRKDKQAKPGEPKAEPDGSPLGPMTKCVCVTYVR